MIYLVKENLTCMAFTFTIEEICKRHLSDALWCILTHTFKLCLHMIPSGWYLFTDPLL